MNENKKREITSKLGRGRKKKIAYLKNQQRRKKKDGQGKNKKSKEVKEKRKKNGRTIEHRKKKKVTTNHPLEVMLTRFPEGRTTAGRGRGFSR